MKHINKELSDKIAVEVALKNVIDEAKDMVKRRRPLTRAKIESILDDRRLIDDLCEQGSAACIESLEFES